MRKSFVRRFVAALFVIVGFGVGTGAAVTQATAAPVTHAPATHSIARPASACPCDWVW